MASADLNSAAGSDDHSNTIFQWGDFSTTEPRIMIRRCNTSLELNDTEKSESGASSPRRVSCDGLREVDNFDMFTQAYGIKRSSIHKKGIRLPFTLKFGSFFPAKDRNVRRGSFIRNKS